MDKPSYRFLDSREDITRFLDSLRSERVLALDLEADSLHSYREKVCLLQVSTPAAHAVIDPLAASGAISGLGLLLADPGVEKVLHGADYDVRLLKKDHGFSVCNVFDTAIAAQFTGRTQFGLAALLEEHFGVRLDKKYQRADWAARPLPRDLLDYAVLDTAYLLSLRRALEAELASLGRLEWAREEFRILESVTPAPPRAPWCLDVKGAHRLQPRQLAVLQGLLEVREDAARERDRPPFKVLSNAVLLAWAETPPANRREILDTRGANRGVLCRLADPILETVRRAQALPLAECPTPTRNVYEPLDRSQENRLKRLKRTRVQLSERIGLPPGLLVNSATLERLARTPPGRTGEALDQNLKHWQREAIGKELEEALGG